MWLILGSDVGAVAIAVAIDNVRVDFYVAERTNMVERRSLSAVSTCFRSVPSLSS